MDRGAWWAAAHGVAKSRTRLSDFTFTFHFPALEKEMATHSSVLIWRIPGTGEPGGLPSKGSNGVGHDWSDLAAAAAAVQVQLAIVVVPGSGCSLKSPGERNLKKQQLVSRLRLKFIKAKPLAAIFSKGSLGDSKMQTKIWDLLG